MFNEKQADRFSSLTIVTSRFTFRYLWFFLEPIMGTKAENYSFLKKMLENIKQTKDKEEQDDESTNQVRSLLKLMNVYRERFRNGALHRWCFRY